MANASEQMPKVDMTKDFSKLSDVDRHFVRKLEAMNLARGKQQKYLKNRNKVTGALLGATILGIYFYTMSAIKQETFLDDFDSVPEKKT